MGDPQEQNPADKILADAHAFLAKHPVEKPAPPAAPAEPDFMTWSASWAKGALCKVWEAACEKTTVDPAPTTPAAPAVHGEYVNNRAEQNNLMDEISGAATKPAAAAPKP